MMSILNLKVPGFWITPNVYWFFLIKSVLLNAFHNPFNLGKRGQIYFYYYNFSNRPRQTTQSVVVY